MGDNRSGDSLTKELRYMEDKGFRGLGILGLRDLRIWRFRDLGIYEFRNLGIKDLWIWEFWDL